MGWGTAAAAALAYYQSKQQAKAAKAASAPLPLYYKEYQGTQQKAMYDMMQPMATELFGGQMPTPAQPTMPTAGWYSGLDENVRAGIEEPYKASMAMAREGLAGQGQLGAMGSGETPAFGGGAADVFAQYAQKAAPAMAQTAWGMMQPGMLMAQEQAWEGQKLPYQMLPSMLPLTYSDLLTSTAPTISPATTGTAQTAQAKALQAQITALQNKYTKFAAKAPAAGYETYGADATSGYGGGYDLGT